MTESHSRRKVSPPVARGTILNRSTLTSAGALNPPLTYATHGALLRAVAFTMTFVTAVGFGACIER